jgi:hypothetical protein
VITREQAERAAAEVIGTPPDHPTLGWELEEFDEGWLVREAWLNDPGVRGGAVWVIERASGRALQFPSSVPTPRILTEYEQVVGDAWVDERSTAARETDGQ